MRTGPFTVRRREGAEFACIYDGVGNWFCNIETPGDNQGDEGIAFALVGVLNAAPADEPLDATLRRLAEGKWA